MPKLHILSVLSFVYIIYYLIERAPLIEADWHIYKLVKL